MSHVAIERYTYADYLNWDGDWELIDGIPLAMTPSPMKIHQNIAYELAYRLREKLEDCEECEVVGELDYKVSEDTILRPDLVLTCNETHPQYLTKAPKIVFEVISKATAKRDEVYKYDIYEKEGVKYYCLIYPDDLVAKLYKLVDYRYQKVGDFSNESFSFSDILCEPTLDFAKVFKRFRK